MTPIRSIFLLLAALALAPATPSSATEAPQLVEVRFDLVAKTPATAPIRGILILRPVAGGEPVRLPVDSASVTTRLTPGTSWEVTPEITGFWAQRRSLVVEQAGSIERMDLWPLAKISGRLRVAEKGAKRPAKVSVTTLAPPLKRTEAPKGLLECPVDDQGGWTCSLPAATYDLVVSAEGFIPHYRWGVAVPPGKTLALGTFELKQGASVAGWVAVEDGPLDPERCIARLSPLTAAGPRDSLPLGQTEVQAKVRKDGFFQFKGVAPGIYSLEVRQPGFAPAGAPSLKVWPRAETFVGDPVLLQRPLTLEVTVQPSLDPQGHSWRLEVLRSSDKPGKLPALVFEGEAGEDGQISIPGQTPGTYTLAVLDSSGNRVQDERDVPIADPADARRTLQVDLITVRGRLTLGREPLSATLWFGGRSGAESIKMESDPEGGFYGVLPRRKSWLVEIGAAEPELWTQARVQVEPDRSGRARIEIALPDTRVFGRVLDEAGAPVPHADVLLLSAEVQMPVLAGEDGTFQARALPAGPLSLAAEGEGNRTSDKIDVVLSEDQAVGPIELRLRATREIVGKVLSPRGPVAGAAIHVMTAPLADAGDSGVTDLGGVFRVRLPEKTRTAVAIVSAPGSALQAFPVDTESADLTFQVRDEAGLLEINLPWAGDEILSRGFFLDLTQNGLPIPPVLLFNWAQRNGGAVAGRQDQTLRIPNLAPGDYQVCLLPGPNRPGASQGLCATGSLQAGGVLSLKLPDTKRPEDKGE